MRRVYAVEIPSLYYENEFVTIHFPRKKDAEYFVNEALYCGRDAKPKINYAPKKEYPNGINWYIIGSRYVYIIWFDNTLWKCTFVGYHMDTAERHDIVFGDPSKGFEVVIIATNYKDALDRGKDLINKAKEAGPWSKDNRAGYLK